MPLTILKVTQKVCTHSERTKWVYSLRVANKNRKSISGYGNVRFGRFQIQFRKFDDVQNGGHRRRRRSRGAQTHGNVFGRKKSDHKHVYVDSGTSL